MPCNFSHLNSQPASHQCVGSGSLLTKSWSNGIPIGQMTVPSNGQNNTMFLPRSLENPKLQQRISLTDSQSKYKNIHNNEITHTESEPVYVGLMRPKGKALKHPAAAELLQYATEGCPVDCGPNWSKERIVAAIAMGPSKSAQHPEAAAVCREEALEKVKEGHCRLIDWDDIKDNPPPNLKISPIAAIPHKSRAYRMILNLAYQIKLNTTKLNSVNETTNKLLAPQHAMFELGNVIPRLIWSMAHAPDNGVPLLFTKIDLKDGYWRMVVNEDNAWNFAYVLPKLKPTDKTQLVIPDALQMGWSESPAFFCAATETGRDIAEVYFRESSSLPTQTNEDIIMNIDWSKIPTDVKQDKDIKILHLLEVYIDDFIGMIQTTDKDILLRLTRSILQAIADIFPSPEETGSIMGPPISAKKLADEGPWETQKEILGWVLDGVARTIHLPQNKCDNLIKILRKLSMSTTITINNLQSIQGKLQFASIGIPLGKPLLGTADKTIANAERKKWKRIKVNSNLKEYSRNWRALLHLMSSRPSNVCELIRHKRPAYQGMVDASKWGVGGVWFSGTKQLMPFVWFFQWPREISEQLCTDENLNGSITISDLELIGIFMHWLALEQAVGKDNLKHQSPTIWCDNIPAVSWVYKFRSNVSTLAANILRAFATRLHYCHAGLLSVDHISGIFNILADFASREHTTDLTNFLILFHQKFPPPQQSSWNLFQFSTKLTCKICSQLLLKTSKMESWRRLSVKGNAFSMLGQDGSVSSCPHYHLASKESQSSNNLMCWLPSVDMLGKEAFQLVNTKYAPKQSRWHFAPSQRRSNWKDNQIPWQTRKENIRKRLANFWRDTDAMTHPHSPNRRSLFRSLFGSVQ